MVGLSFTSTPGSESIVRANIRNTNLMYGSRSGTCNIGSHISYHELSVGGPRRVRFARSTLRPPTRSSQLTVNHLQDAVVALYVRKNVAHLHVFATGGVQGLGLVDLPGLPAARRVAEVPA